MQSKRRGRDPHKDAAGRGVAGDGGAMSPPQDAGLCGGQGAPWPSLSSVAGLRVQTARVAVQAGHMAVWHPARARKRASRHKHVLGVVGAASSRAPCLGFCPANWRHLSAAPASGARPPPFMRPRTPNRLPAGVSPPLGTSAGRRGGGGARQCSLAVGGSIDTYASFFASV